MSTTFTATHPFGDPSLDSFTWKGNDQFFIPSGPNDVIWDTSISPDYQNTDVQMFWQHFNPATGAIANWVIHIDFAPNGRWLEDVSGWGQFGNHAAGYEIAWEGIHGLKHFYPPHLPPVDQVLAEGPWAPHHHAAAVHHDALIFG